MVMNIILIVLSFGAGLLFCEGVLRFVYPQNLAVWYKTRDDLTIHRPDHRGIFRSVETVQSYETNSFGMRDKPHELTKDDGAFRILLLGDSHMEALQVPFEQSFPHLLEGRLQSLTKRSIEVINAGVAGWGTDEELTYLIRYGTKFAPDVILVAMTLHNDIYDNLEQNYHSLEGDRLIEKPRTNIPYWAYKFWQVKALLGSHSHLYQMLRMWWHSEEIQLQGQELSDQVAQLLQKEPSKTIDYGWQLTFSLFDSMQKIGKQSGARCIVFLIPLAIQVEEERLSRFLHDHRLTPDLIELERPQRMMKSLGAANQMMVVDLLPAFRQWMASQRSALYLKKDGHLTEDGHQLAANIVAEALTRERVFERPQAIGNGS